MKTGLKYDFTLIQLLLIPTCVAISVVGYQISQMLKLPLYLDIAGLSIAAMLGGPWIAVLTGILNHFFNGMLYPIAFPFMPVSIAIGFAVGIMSKHGLLTSDNNFVLVIKLFFVVLIMSLIGAIVSAPIVVLLFGGVTGSTTDILTAVFLQSGQEIVNAVFSQSFIIGMINNTVNLLIAIFIIRRISPRYLTKTNYGSKFIKKSKKKYTVDGEVVRNEE